MRKPYVPSQPAGPSVPRTCRLLTGVPPRCCAWLRDAADFSSLSAPFDGAMPMEEVLGTLRPEAAYFYPHNGHRAMMLVVDVRDKASVVTPPHARALMLQTGR